MYVYEVLLDSDFMVALQYTHVTMYMHVYVYVSASPFLCNNVFLSGTTPYQLLIATHSGSSMYQHVCVCVCV